MVIKICCVKILIEIHKLCISINMKFTIYCLCLLNYSNIIFSAILSIFLFGVYPDKLSVVGYFIIFAAAFYMFLYNKRQDKLSK